MNLKILLYLFKLSSTLTLTSNDRPLPADSAIGHAITRTLVLKSSAPRQNIQGVLRVKVYKNEDGSLLLEKTQDVSVSNDHDFIYTYAVTLKYPASYNAEYSFIDNSGKDSAGCTILLAYKSYPHDNDHLASPVVERVLPGKSLPFALENVQLDGFLKARLDANLAQRLLHIDETGILECFYNRPGKQSWVGEYAGKYLSAASRVWRYSKDPGLKVQMDRIVDILIACQKKDGYLGTYTPDNYWTEWDVWAHKYDLLGLLSYYSATGSTPALETSRRIGDLLCRTFGTGPGQRDLITVGEHMGMASTSVLEPMTLLYRFTGDRKYLDFCRYIIADYDSKGGPRIVSTLNQIGKVDRTANGKAYEMLSNLVGIVRLYQLTGEPALLTAATNAWKDISTHKLYITGTASTQEIFTKDFVLPADNDAQMGEGCVSVTWLQLSQALFELTGDATYMEEIEKTIYNHLFAAENPETGCVSYYTALEGIKPYRCTIDGHCCLASIPRGFAIIPELVYTKNSDNGLSLNIYSPGKLTDTVVTSDGQQQPLTVNISSGFPDQGQVSVTLHIIHIAHFRMDLRVPAWCNHFTAVINNKTYSGTPGQYLHLDRTWKDNDSIRISFGLHAHLLDGGKSYPGFVAIKNGPQVLAIDQSLNSEIKANDDVRITSSDITMLPDKLLPQGWIGSQIYELQGMVRGKPVALRLVPFAEAGQTGGQVWVWIRKS